MIFGKHINRYYLRHFPLLLLGVLALVAVDYLQLVIPNLYGMVIAGMDEGGILALIYGLQNQSDAEPTDTEVQQSENEAAQ